MKMKVLKAVNRVSRQVKGVIANKQGFAFVEGLIIVAAAVALVLFCFPVLKEGLFGFIGDLFKKMGSIFNLVG